MSATAGVTAAPAERGLWRDAWRRLRGRRAVLAAGLALCVIALLALLGPLVSVYTFDALDYTSLARAPDFASGPWFGTDDLGRDLFVRTLLGLRISLAVGLLATAVSVLIGVSYGAVAGFVGGRIDELMMRAVDLLFALPQFFFVLLLAVLFDQNLIVLFVTIGAFGWLVMARIVRGQTLSLRRREFIEAAGACGVPTARVLTRHVLPNVLGPEWSAQFSEYAEQSFDRRVGVLTTGMHLVIPVGNRPLLPEARDQLGRSRFRAESGREYEKWGFGESEDAAFGPFYSLHAAPRAGRRPDVSHQRTLNSVIVWARCDHRRRRAERTNKRLHVEPTQRGDTRRRTDGGERGVRM